MQLQVFLEEGVQMNLILLEVQWVSSLRLAPVAPQHALTWHTLWS